MTRYSVAVCALTAALPGVCAAQATPSLAAAGSGFVLTVPYVEYGSGTSKLAFAVSLGTSNLSEFTLDAASVRSQPPLASAIDSPTVASLNSGYRFALPRISYSAGGTTRYYSATLNSDDLSRFALDAASVREIAAPPTLASPSGVTVTNVNQRTVGSSIVFSSSKLLVGWSAPAGYTVDHYEINAAESVYGASSSATALASETTKTLTGLKAGTPYAVTVMACSNSACSQSGISSAVNGTTSEEYWQLQGSGSTVSGLTKIVSDGNARISATRFGPEAGTVNASRIQLYYGPMATTTQQLATAVTSQATDATISASYLNFTSMAGTTGLISPSTAATLVRQVATGQAVPLSAAMGGKVRLFFEAAGSDNKTRILYLDSHDGYTGRNFNSGSATTCSTTADYQTGGGCAPTVAIGVEGDSTNANSRIGNARQFKIGFPILNDWRWDGAPGTFMVFTNGPISRCSSSSHLHGFAAWDGSRWNVQYDSAGCPKLFANVQAMFPMHLGEARYKMYFGDPSITAGKGNSNLPFLGPKKLIYADGRSTGSAATVDFDDWESTASGRNVVFVWPNGNPLDAGAEGYIDDFHFLAPTASLDLQVMYMAITDGTQVPIGAAAILLNP